MLECFVAMAAETQSKDRYGDWKTNQLGHKLIEEGFDPLLGKKGPVIFMPKLPSGFGEAAFRNSVGTEDRKNRACGSLEDGSHEKLERAHTSALSHCFVS